MWLVCSELRILLTEKYFSSLGFERGLWSRHRPLVHLAELSSWKFTLVSWGGIRTHDLGITIHRGPSTPSSSFSFCSILKNISFCYQSHVLRSSHHAVDFDIWICWQLFSTEALYHSHSDHRLVIKRILFITYFVGLSGPLCTEHCSIGNTAINLIIMWITRRGKQIWISEK